MLPSILIVNGPPDGRASSSEAEGKGMEKVFGAPYGWPVGRARRSDGKVTEKIFGPPNPNPTKHIKKVTTVLILRLFCSKQNLKADWIFQRLKLTMITPLRERNLLRKTEQS